MFHNSIGAGKEAVDRKPPYKYVLGMLYCCFICSQYTCCILQLRPALLLETVLLLFQTTLTPGHYWRLGYYWRPGLLLEKIRYNTVSVQIFGPSKSRPPRANSNTHFGRIKFSACTAAACIHCHTEPCKTNFRQNMARPKINMRRIFVD